MEIRIDCQQSQTMDMPVKSPGISVWRMVWRSREFCWWLGWTMGLVCCYLTWLWVGN